MLVIRLLRVGKKHQPSFRVVVTEKSSSPRGGKSIEKLGFLNPLTKENSLNKERIQYWLSQGAKCSDTVHNLLIREKVIEGKKIDVHKESKKKKEEGGEVPKEKPKTEEKSTEAGKAPKEESKPEEPKVEEKKEETPKEEPKTEELKPEEKKEEPKEVPEEEKEEKVEEKHEEKEEEKPDEESK